MFQVTPAYTTAEKLGPQVGYLAALRRAAAAVTGDQLRRAALLVPTAWPDKADRRGVARWFTGNVGGVTAGQKWALRSFGGHNDASNPRPLITDPQESAAVYAAHHALQTADRTAGVLAANDCYAAVALRCDPLGDWLVDEIPPDVAAAQTIAYDAAIALTVRDTTHPRSGWNHDTYTRLSLPWRLAVGPIHPDDGDGPVSESLWPLPDYGPNALHLLTLADQARNLTAEQGWHVFQNESKWLGAEIRALRRALAAAGRLEAADTDVPGIGLGLLTFNALLGRDLFGTVPGWNRGAYNRLTRAWRQTVAQIHPDDRTAEDRGGLRLPIPGQRCYTCRAIHQPALNRP